MMEDLLNPRHPSDQCHASQLAALAAAPQDEREELARLFRLGNATYRYQQQAVVTEADFADWLTGLPAKLRAVVEREGFEKSKASLGLRRHALERRDVGYQAYLQATLSPQDWAYQQQMSQEPTPGPAGSVD